MTAMRAFPARTRQSRARRPPLLALALLAPCWLAAAPLPARPGLEPPRSERAPAPVGSCATGAVVLWQSAFEQGLADWPARTPGWGEANRSFHADPGVRGRLLRVRLPEGSIDPGTMARRGLPYGGTGFRARVLPEAIDRARLSYKLRFPADFRPGRGGKLPGLCGGRCNAGGLVPDGTDGFSVRYMWTGNFAASVYAYLPSSRRHGTTLGARRVPLERGRWIELTQEVKLNAVGRADGHLKVWKDGRLVVEAGGLVFRTDGALGIDTVIFDVFYGGSQDSWAAPADTVIEFAEFTLALPP